MHTFLRWLRFRADDSCTCEDWTEREREHCENLTILKYRLDMHINELHTASEAVREWEGDDGMTIVLTLLLFFFFFISFFCILLLCALSFAEYSYFLIPKNL